MMWINNRSFPLMRPFHGGIMTWKSSISARLNSSQIPLSSGLNYSSPPLPTPLFWHTLRAARLLCPIVFKISGPQRSADSGIKIQSNAD